MGEGLGSGWSVVVFGGVGCRVLVFVDGVVADGDEDCGVGFLGGRDWGDGVGCWLGLL